MNQRKEPLVRLGVQGRSLSDQPRIRAPRRAVVRKDQGFPLWYICGMVFLVSGLSYLLVPAIRERANERLAVLSGAPLSSMASAPGNPMPGAAASASGVSVSAPAAAVAAPAAPASQAAAAEAYFAASMARQKSAGGAPAAKAAAPSSANESPAAEPPVARNESPSPRTSSAAPGSSRRTPPVLVKGKRLSDPAEENASVVSQPLTPIATPAPENNKARSEEAYKILLDKVPAMAAIAAKSDPAMQLKSWSVVKAEEIEFWIDLVAIRSSDKQEEHFIWKIRIDEQTVSPLNQSARRLAGK